MCMGHSTPEAENPITRSAYEVAIWCTVLGESEEEVRDLVFEWCQRLKGFLDKGLVVKAIEVGAPR